MSDTENHDETRDAGTHSSLAHPHDRLVRTVLADADIAADLLRNYLDPRFAEAVDFDSLVRDSADSADSGLATLVGDLRFSARFRGGEEKLDVVVLVEHQSRPDRLMRFRMLEYVVAAFRRHVPAMEKDGLFPFPLPVVLHHGARPWKRIPAMSELIAMRPGLPNDILDLPISLIDAAAMQLDDLPGHPMVCALLDSLQSASTGRLPERVAGVFGRLRPVRGESRLRGWTTALATYYLAVQGGVQENLDALTRALKIFYSTTEAEDMTTTFAQSWIEEGKALGKLEGRREGRREGVLEGRREGVLEGRREGVLEGERRALMAAARSALAEGLSPEAVARFTGLPPAEIERLAHPAGEGAE